MRADLPLCNFKNCKYQFDGNCTVKERFDDCDYTRLYLKCINFNHVVHDVINMLEGVSVAIPS